MAEQPLDAYATEHIRDALAQDPRVGALDVRVRMAGDVLVVTGNVPTEQRRSAIGEVVTDLAPGVEVRNDVTVADLSEPPDQEVVS